MLGIIFSLIAALAALSFAFHCDDKGRRAHSEWRNSAHHRSEQRPAFTEEADAKDRRNAT
jgi:hypothetical protein